MKSRIVLASASARRKELLTQCGVTFEIEVADIDETPEPEEAPAHLVQRLSADKAGKIADRHPDAWVIGADTIVVVNDQILGKPADKTDAVRMLQMLQGRDHRVFGGIAVLCREKQMETVASYVTKVKVAELSHNMIEAYVATGEPLDKAGAYAIQGIGSQFIEAIDGSYTNVVGLDTTALMKTLRSLGAIEI